MADDQMAVAVENQGDLAAAVDGGGFAAEGGDGAEEADGAVGEGGEVGGEDAGRCFHFEEMGTEGEDWGEVEGWALRRV